MNLYFCDMHCDTITTLYDDRQKGSQNTLFDNSLMLDIKKMQKSGYLLQNFAVFLNQKKYKELFVEAEQRVAYFKEEMCNNSDKIAQVFSFSDIERNSKAGKMSSLLTLEGGEILEGSMKNLYHFYDEGVRMMTLTWNYPNEIGYPNINLEPYMKDHSNIPDFVTADTIHGLSRFGIEVLQEMERLHIIVDVSHGSDALFYDVCQYAREPFVASHSNARGMYGKNRNLSDSMIKKLADKGGIMGINFCADFISEKSSRDQITYINDITEQIIYIKKIGGIECIGLGSDFDGIENQLEFDDASGLLQLYKALIKKGFHERECDKIFRDNVLRIYRERL